MTSYMSELEYKEKKDMLVHRKPVACFDEDGRLMGSWKSTLKAATENDGKPGYSKQVIKTCTACQRRTECSFCKYFRKYHRTWRYTEEV